MIFVPTPDGTNSNQITLLGFRISSNYVFDAAGAYKLGLCSFWKRNRGKGINRPQHSSSTKGSRATSTQPHIRPKVVLPGSVATIIASMDNMSGQG
jgi:hypothetical protein